MGRVVLALCALFVLTSSVAVAKGHHERPPSPEAVLAKLHEVEAQLAGVAAILESPVDEGERRGLIKRIAKLDKDVLALRRLLEGVLGQPHEPPPVVQAPPPTPPQEEPGLPAPDLEALLRGLKAAHFGSERMSILEAALELRDVTVAQAARILPLFPFSEERVAAARYLVPRLSDPERAFTLLSVMQFDSDKEEVKKIITESRGKRR